MCYRRRCTDKHVKPVGEVRKGYATGYIWECMDIEDCETTMNTRTANRHNKMHLIQIARAGGRATYYIQET